MSLIETPDEDTLEICSSPVPHQEKLNYPFWYGGFASMVACCFTHPLDLAKVRLQTAPNREIGLLKTIGLIIKDEGFTSLYAGLSAALLRQATYSTTRFGTYEYLKDLFTKNDGKQPSNVILLPASMVSGAIGGLVGNPADVVNIRMQNDLSMPLDKRRNYSNAFDGLYRIAKEEGFTAFFKGLGPNLTRGILMTTSQVVTYDVVKKISVEEFQMDEKSKVTHFTSSLTAGFVATTVCSPADVVKTRIMSNHPTSAAGSGVSGVSGVSGAGSSGNVRPLEIILNAVKVEGVGFMFRGWVPAFVRLGPQTILTFLVLEQLRSFKIGMKS
ncbi:hypothetical protein PACTADRAFT_49968 [Pachysolen tannophilus NRRL Y-2460]|uniref:Mitochondrial dicarboxylate transporter n=1 Tax=Pachysolen tannophilus NRRL Y-2460 TaxID=669874 RepID=A0A1E4TU04_PACTA|nr:hypothetical protein PACTADRAFT_49968 [Pachysolen tannophilus NRRL Y-2460]